MREKELRIALVCYGGISLAVYMHGITKEVWRLAKASRAFHTGETPGNGSQGVYHELLRRIAEHAEIDLRILVDIMAGASAGGINAIFLAHAIAGGRPLDPLTDLWLDSADVDRLIDPEVSAVSRFAKNVAVPFAWMMSRSGTVDQTVEPAHRAEVRAKLAQFVRAKWLSPPFGGPGLTNLLLDAPYTPAFEGRTAPFQFSDFAFDSQTNLRRHHASYQADGTIATKNAGTHVGTALVDWDGERATLVDALAKTTVPASRDNVGVTLQHQAMWSRAFITAGVRFEHNASFGNATVPRIAAAFYARSGGSAVGATRISANFGRGIKEPTINQSFSPNPFFLGNPDLEPEKARTAELGVEQRLANDRLRVNAAWFDNSYRNIIATRTISFNPFVSQYFNIGLTSARGAEVAADVALVSGVRAKGGYTFTDSEILESTSTNKLFQVGNWAFRRPRNAGFMNLAWTGARASFDLSGTFSGRRVDSDFSSLQLPIESNDGYSQWDVRAIVRLTRVLSLTGAIDNLTDSDRMDPLGYPVLGRAARGGLRLRW